ncbi:MAG: hypothetical protein WCF67_07050 [Chitinophagaceae bacterium]
MRTARRPGMIFCLTVLSVFFFSSASVAQSKDEIINGSYFVAFGRFASSGELTYWRQNVGNRNIQQMVDNHRNYLKDNKIEREKAVKLSYMDAFGWQPSADELRYWTGQNKTYAEMMTNHIQNWLNVYADKKEHVIKQSYYKVFARSATKDEVKYWMGQPTYSFVQLVAIHTTWKQMNQNSSTLTKVKPNINANDISTAGFSPQAISGVVAAGGMNVIAPGGGNVVAAGGMNAIAR